MLPGNGLGHIVATAAAVVLAGSLLSGCSSGSSSGSSGGANEPAPNNGTDHENEPSIPGGSDPNGGADDENEPSIPIISELSLVGAPISAGDQVHIVVSASSTHEQAALSYAWDVPEGWSGDSDSDVLVLEAPEEGGRGTVTVRVSNGAGETQGSLVVATNGPVIESFSVDLSADPPLRGGDEAVFSVTAHTWDGTAVTYHYDVGGSRFEERGPEWTWTVAPTMGGTYRLQATVEDENGLTASTGMNIEIAGAAVWSGFGGSGQRTGRSLGTAETGSAAGDGHWEFGTAHAVRSSPAVGGDGTVYVGSHDKHVYALDPDDGSEKWRFKTGDTPDDDARVPGVDSSPALGADGTVYFGSIDEHVYALDPDDGSKKWRFNAGGIVRSSPALGADGTVYVGSYDNHLYALDPEDGSEKWRFETGDDVRSSLSVGADGTVYVGSYDNHLYALDPEDGSEKWRFETGGDIFSSPAVSPGGTIYVGSNDNRVYALHADGTKKWSRVSGNARSILSSPALGADGTVYVGSRDHHVYALDPTDGTERWRYETGGPIDASPALGADGTIYIGSYDNHVYALDPDDGSKKWSYATDSVILSSPAVGADGTVFIGSDDYKLHAIR